MNEIVTVEKTPEALPAQVQEPVSLLNIINRAAADPSTDVDKLERLMGLYERITARESEQRFNEAMAEAQKEMPRVLRDAKNDTTNSRYSRLETVAQTIGPVIAKHGFAMSFGTDNSHMAGHYRVTCKVSHNAGHSHEYHVDIPVDDVGMKGTKNKTLVHGFGSSMSYGRRYLTLLIFNVTMKNEDDDGNAAGGGEISDEQKDELIALMKDTGADTKRFLEFMGAESVDAIPAKSFAKAKNALEAKRKAVAK